MRVRQLRTRAHGRLSGDGLGQEKPELRTLGEREQGRASNGRESAPSVPRRTKRVQVLVVDSHELVHWGFRLLLAQQPWVEGCHNARNGEEAVELARRVHPHVAVVDVVVHDQPGGDISRRIRAVAPATQTLLISDPATISRDALRAARACGVVAPDTPVSQILSAVRLAALGTSLLREREPQPPALAMSSREREVLKLIAAGLTNREVAAALYVSPNTIKHHTRTLYRKLSARNRVDAVQRAHRLGLL